MEAGSGAAGAPTNSTLTITLLPSGVKSPAWNLPADLRIQPVPRGLIVDVQAPSSVLDKTGGRGSSTISKDSGEGGEGTDWAATRLAPTARANVVGIIMEELRVAPKGCDDRELVVDTT